MRAGFFRCLTIGGLAVVLQACASLELFPPQSGDMNGELEALKPYFAPDVLPKYNEMSDPAARRRWRDIIVDGRLRAVDLHFIAYQQALFRESIKGGIAVDWAILALNAAGALSGGAANALAATSAGLVGAKASFDKHALFDKTLPALMATMVAKRKETLVRIRGGLADPDVNRYPLAVALNDVDTYYYAGSIPGALIEIAETSGAKAKKADDELNNILTVAPVPPDVAARMKRAATCVKTLDDKTRLGAMATALRVPPDQDPLVGVLEKIAAAQTSKDADRVALILGVLGCEGI